MERLAGSSLGERTVLRHALHERISIQETGRLPGYFVRGANQRMRYADVDSCEAKGWIERTARCTFRITEAGRLALNPDEGVTLSTVQQRIDNESKVST